MPNEPGGVGTDLPVELRLALAAGSRPRTELEGALRDAVRAGRLLPGVNLPSTRALAAELGLSRGTVSAAYDQLVAEGYLLTRHGSGTVVAEFPATASTVETGPGPVGSITSPDPPGRHDVPPAVRYDLRPGHPDLTAFPAGAWARAVRRALVRAPASALGDGDPRGRPELREALAGYLGRVRGVVASPERIVVTTGAVQALSLLAEVLVADGAVRVAMEDPGPSFHRQVVARRGAVVVPVEVDAHGARTDTLARSGASAVVLTPAHQFPVGVPLGPERRQRAVGWAARAGGLLVEDDSDGEFRYDRPSLGALQGAAPEHVVYLGTAASTLAPGVRLAWLVLPARLVDPVVEAKRHADLTSEVVGQLALAELISGHGYDRHVRAARLRYRRRRDLLLAVLAPWAGRGFVARGIAAGLQARVDLPDAGPGEDDVVAAAAARGLALEGVGPWWHDPADRPPGLVIGFGTPDDSSYPGALDALVRTLSDRTLPA